MSRYDDYDEYEEKYEEEYEEEYEDDDYYDERRASQRGISSNVKWVIAMIVELVIIVLLGFGLFKQYVSSKYSLMTVDNIQKEKLAIDKKVEEETKGFTQIALFGVDSRDSNMGKGSRSDAIIVASINNDTKEVKLVSVYRDTLLEIQKDNPVTSKVNVSYAFGGPEMAVKTLNANMDLSITEYITVNWEGLTRAIDALGGVQVHIEEEELEMLNGLIMEQISSNGIYSDGVFATGDITLNGVQATAYSRLRNTGQGDITRTERQREVIGSMVEKLKASDLSTINNMINELFPYIRTSITEEEMYSLAKSIASYELTDTSGFPFRFTYYNNKEKGACLAAQDLTDNVRTLHKFLFNEADYTPSEKVSTLNAQLLTETGAASTGDIPVPGEETDGDADDTGE
ncbi:MAG: LCP family protein [Eubacterium sp.]|nr:LCP family protein [Eubacterium sp.]